MTEKERKKKPGEVSRREFLKDAGLLVGGTAIGSTVLLAACGDGETVTETVTQKVPSFVCPTCGLEFDTLSELKDHIAAAHPAGEPVKYAPASQMVQVDPYYCASCSTCAAICSTRAWGESNPALSAIKITQNRMNGEVTINTCHQCAAPSCMQACMFDAMYIDENTGARVIDQDKCTGCRQCQNACPFDAVVYNPKTNTCFKCDLCGGNPLCVEHCTAGEACLTLVNPIKGGA